MCFIIRRVSRSWICSVSTQMFHVTWFGHCTWFTYTGILLYPCVYLLCVHLCMSIFSWDDECWANCWHCSVSASVKCLRYIPALQAGLACPSATEPAWEVPAKTLCTLDLPTLWLRISNIFWVTFFAYFIWKADLGGKDTSHLADLHLKCPNSVQLSHLIAQCTLEANWSTVWVFPRGNLTGYITGATPGFCSFCRAE